MVEHILEVLGQHLDHEPRLREHDRLQLRPDRMAGQPVGLRARRRANAEIGIDNGWVPEKDVTLASRCAALGNRGHLCTNERFGVFLRVADGRRAQDELRRDIVERADSLEAAQDIGHVRSEHAAVRVDLVNDDVAQVLEELRPLRMVRQDGVMQHVRVRDDDVAVNADRLTCVVRRIAVKRVGPHTEFPSAVELKQLSNLVLREGFRGKEVEGLRTFRDAPPQ